MAIHDISFMWGETTLNTLSKTFEDRTLFSETELSKMSKQLDELNRTIQSPKAKEQLQELYGYVEALRIDHLVDHIVDESFLLFKSRNKLRPQVLVKKIATIQKEIEKIWYEQALSLSNKRFIRMSVLILNVLKVFPSSKTDDVLNIANVSNLMKDEDMLPDSEVRTSLIEPEIWESAELAFDLCEMAHAFYQNKINEGMKRLHLLNPSEKSRLEELCLILGAELPQHFQGKSVPLYRENIIRFIQALIWRANEIAQGHSTNFYPSPSEIHMMFSEVEALEAEENSESLPL